MGEVHEKGALDSQRVEQIIKEKFGL